MPFAWPLPRAAEDCFISRRKMRESVSLRSRPLHDHVDHAVLEQIFGALESVGQALADGLLDHARAGEADQRARLGDLHIAQHGIGGRHAARGRIGQHHDIGQARFVQHVHADGGARHLHQGKDALLHARAARGDDQDEGPPLGDRGAHGGDQPGAGRKPERAAHEVEALHRDDDGQPVQRPARGDQRIALPGLGAVFLQPVAIALVVAEAQRVLRHLRRGQALMRALVEQRRKPLLRADAHMVAALRTDVLRGHEIAVEHHLAAAGAFAPQIVLGRGLGAHQALDPWADEIGYPVHGRF